MFSDRAAAKLHNCSGAWGGVERNGVAVFAYSLRLSANAQRLFGTGRQYDWLSERRYS